jgi:hypothetical protein
MKFFIAIEWETLKVLVPEEDIDRFFAIERMCLGYEVSMDGALELTHSSDGSLRLQRYTTT